jgi:hypothetical protein
LQQKYEADIANITPSTDKYHDGQERYLNETLLTLKEIKLRAQQLNIAADALIKRIELFQALTEHVTEKVKTQAEKAKELNK